ncbi:hypothetical protein ZOSMA_81G00390 [Zostera marina]|uniref:Uncharacterized protein n=1 Tax=Zostera marina TaxID=29655 RepID=A0A0K9NM27_ZOSMR|nr:hypothetical protein ZOSMA_81G00390 [Zostera marina]
MTENTIFLPTPAPVGMRYRNLKTSFKLALKSLLEKCSKEDVYAILSSSSFSEVEKKAFHRFFVQVTRRLHETVHEEFEAICEKTQVGSILNTVEQLVDEQSLASLSRENTIFEDMEKKIVRVKKDEVSYLMNTIKEIEEKNNHMKTRIASLKSNQNSRTASATASLAMVLGDIVDPSKNDSQMTEI